jgi:hypothetical protein
MLLSLGLPLLLIPALLSLYYQWTRQNRMDEALINTCWDGDSRAGLNLPNAPTVIKKPGM